MSEENHPNPDALYPIPTATRLVFLKNIIKNPQISVGDFTYYDDPQDVHNFERNVLYLFDFVDDKLIIGKFCQIATGVRFIMNGANHAMDGVSTYPFQVMSKSWFSAPAKITRKGYTIVGNDVWFGNSATIMQGVKIGDGAIIGTNSVVTKDVEPYTIVAGNPARVIRKRFDEETIEFLVKLKWWDWPLEKITKNLDLITGSDIEALKKLQGNNMQKIITNLPLIKLAGITAYTNNAAEMTKEGKIGPTLQKYFGENLPAKIQNRKNPSRTFCIYTNFESDHTGNYTYFVGEEVTEFDGIEEGFEKLEINSQAYTKFTTEPGPMPEICINAWQKIWTMNDADFGGERTYIADFEIYDERSIDPQNTVLDIYIGIKK